MTKVNFNNFKNEVVLVQVTAPLGRSLDIWSPGFGQLCSTLLLAIGVAQSLTVSTCQAS